MSRFQGTSLPSFSTNATSKEIQTEVRKAILDLLKKDNAIYDELFPLTGTTPNGSYIKFPNGVMYQWLYDIQTYSVTVGYGTLFAANTGTTWTFPIPFIAFNYVVNVNVARNGTSMWSTLQTEAALNQIAFTILDVANRGSVPVEVHRTAIGFWK